VEGIGEKILHREANKLDENYFLIAKRKVMKEHQRRSHGLIATASTAA
jgi:hypothetical protein